jgi:serine/threonine protein kinase/tetratricopeptide (TPR) repeat protein
MTPSTSFGRYQLIELIARGGMAELYLATQRGVAGFEKQIVIKRIRPEFADNPRFISMFINEANISVHLNHPNVVQTYDLGRVGTSYYIAMEHLRGHDLNKVVKVLRKRPERLPQETAVYITAEILRGLHHAHNLSEEDGESFGLVHRDVSPHNIFLTTSGEVKLVDFGIARVMHTHSGEVESPASNRPGGGKYAYMSPEQAMGKSVDHRTDIFSAGIVLWELLMGHRLFQHDDPKVKLKLVTDAVVPTPDSEGIDVDKGLWDTLAKALEREPKNRHQSARTFEEALRAWLFEQQSTITSREVSGVLRDTFPDDFKKRHSSLNLRKLAADVGQLDAIDATGTNTDASQGTDVTLTGLPGNLPYTSGGVKPITTVVAEFTGLDTFSITHNSTDVAKERFRLFRWLQRIVTTYGGLVQRAVDNRVLIVFGSVQTRSDDVFRALDCVRHLQNHVSQTREEDRNIRLAIGIHQGEATIAHGKRNSRISAVGDTVRLAERLATFANHDQALVSQKVMSNAELTYHFGLHSGVSSRGGHTDTAYVLNQRREEPQFDRDSPWLRRGDELKVIRAAMTKVDKGRNATILITGKAGSGKTRLTQEIISLAKRSGMRCHTGRCSPFGEHPPLAPFRQVVASIIGITSTNHLLKASSFAHLLAPLNLSTKHISALSDLMNLQRTSSQNSASPAQVWEAIKKLLSGVAKNAPIIIKLDNAHHMPTRECDDLVQLIRGTRDFPILFLINHVGEPPIKYTGGISHIKLGAFSGPLQRRHIRNLLRVVAVSEKLWLLISQTCEGNPLYIREMVRHLKHHNKIQIVNDRAELIHDSDYTMPESLAALIAARIDALDPASRGMLQLGAIIGDRFSGKLISGAAGIPDATLILSTLANHALIMREPNGDNRWAFKSSLVRDATIRGMLPAQIRDCHRLVSGAIAQLPEAQALTYQEANAHHCAGGEHYLSAARNGYAAAKSLVEKQQFYRARDLLRLSKEWAARINKDPKNWDARVQGEAMIALTLGEVELTLGDFSKANVAFTLALDIAGDAGVPWVEVPAHLHLGNSYLSQGKLLLAKAHLQQATRLHSARDEPELQVSVLHARANLAVVEGQTTQAVNLLTEAIALSSGDYAAEAKASLSIARAYLRSGDLKQARPVLDRALEAAIQSKDRIIEGKVRNNLGVYLSSIEDYKGALIQLQLCIDLREGTGYTRGLIAGYHNLADAYLELNDHGHAWVAFKRSQELADDIGWEHASLINETYLSYLGAQTHQDEENRQRLVSAIEHAMTINNYESAATGLWLQGRLLVSQNLPVEAKKALADCVKMCTEYSVPHVSKRAQLLSSQL